MFKQIQTYVRRYPCTAVSWSMLAVSGVTVLFLIAALFGYLLGYYPLTVNRRLNAELGPLVVFPLILAVLCKVVGMSKGEKI